MFAEKGALDNQTASYNGEVISGECGLSARNFDVNNKKILIATRYLRNDSKTIQLELRYDNYGDKQEQMKQRKHIRSNSCDVKIGRSNSRDYDSEYRMRRPPNNASNNNNQHSHSRNNSRDFDSDFRQKLTHTRTHSSDHANIKYILNYLKPDHSKLLTAYVSTSDGSTSRASRKHSRNHSYDQIYNMPNNIKLDHELHSKFNKNRLNAVAAVGAAIASGSAIDSHDVNLLKMSKEFSDNKFAGKSSDGPGTSTGIVKLSHSRNNSKDLNGKLPTLATIVDDNGSDSILRHRRTNSKDLNRNVSPSTSTLLGDGGAAATPTLAIGPSNGLNHMNLHQQPLQQQSHNHHVRNLSQPKIQIDQEIQESAHLLMQRRQDIRDTTEQYGNDTQHRL